MGAQRVEWQAFGRMCLKGRNREQAPSHIGSAVFIHGVSGAGSVWCGLEPSHMGSAVFIHGVSGAGSGWGGLEPFHMGSAVFIHGVSGAGSVWEGACPR